MVVRLVTVWLSLVNIVNCLSDQCVMWWSIVNCMSDQCVLWWPMVNCLLDQCVLWWSIVNCLSDQCALWWPMVYCLSDLLATVNYFWWLMHMLRNIVWRDNLSVWCGTYKAACAILSHCENARTQMHRLW